MQKRYLMLMAFLLLADATVSSAQREIPADEIIAKVETNQPAEYYNVTIIGDLNLSKLSPPVVRSDFVIVNSTIVRADFDGVSFEKNAAFWGTSFGNASFEKASFSGMADFNGTSFGNTSFLGASFSQPVTFDGARFEKSISFVDSGFQKDASFNFASFGGDADLNYSRFGYYTYFSGASFLGNASFSDVSFQGVFDCSATNFSRNVNFFQSRFEDAASFSDSAFGGRAQFGLVKFDGLSSFESTTFSDEAVFNLARFGDVAYFYGARFMDKAFFGLTKFEDTASFQSASFEDDLILKGAQISTMILDKASYGKDTRVVLNDTNFARLKAPWNEIEDHVVYDPGAYLALINNYHGLGWATDEDNCYYSYRKLDQNHKDLSWSKIIDYLAWLSCGYGVKPSYAVAWSLLTIIIFAMIFWIGDGIRRSSKPLQGPAETDPVPERATFRNALFFSTMIFLSQGPIDFLPVGRHRYSVIIEGIIGWLLLALFLVTLGKVMIR